MMRKKELISFKDDSTSLNFPDFGEGDAPRMPLTDHAFRKGQRDASKHTDDRLIEMLGSKNIEDVYEALGAIGIRKLKKALPFLKNIALYDDDLAIQAEAIRTIRRIGGRKAFEILRLLKSTEHKELAEKMLELKYIEDIDAC